MFIKLFDTNITLKLRRKQPLRFNFYTLNKKD